MIEMQDVEQVRLSRWCMNSLRGQFRYVLRRTPRGVLSFPGCIEVLFWRFWGKGLASAWSLTC